MRNPRFIARHRGGSLTIENHRALIRWARECSQHVLPLLNDNVDERLLNALTIAEAWENERVKTGEAMNASVAAHAVARKYTDPVAVAVARSVGHCVATAHMADHSLGAALYARKAVNLAGKSMEEENAWQLKRLQLLPSEIVELVLEVMKEKESYFKMV